MSLLLTLSLYIWHIVSQEPGSVLLKNAAYPNVKMPVIGLGTGGYSAAKSKEAHPEHWYPNFTLCF